MKFKLPPLLAAAIGLAASANAAVIIDTTATTPVSQGNFATGTAANLATGAAWTFKTGVLGSDINLDSIGLEGRQTGQNTNVYTLELWTDTDNDAQTLGGTLIGTSTNSTALTALVTSQFNFTGITLTDNTVFTVHVVGTTPGFGLIGSTTTDLLADSRLFQNNAFVFGGTGTNGIDSSFSVTTSAIPEPSTYGLLGAGALAAVAFVRRRRKLAV